MASHLTTVSSDPASTRFPTRLLVELASHVRGAFAGGWRVWTVTASLVTAACLASVAVWDTTAAIDQPRVPFWLLLGAFALVETFPIHVQFRSEASSFSFFEIPLIIGALLSDASALIPVVAIGSTVLLLAVRRQPFPKLVFNGANQVLQAALTVMLIDALNGSIDPFTPRGSVVMLFAAAVASSQGVAAIGAVIVASEGREKAMNSCSFHRKLQLFETWPHSGPAHRRPPLKPPRRRPNGLDDGRGWRATMASWSVAPTVSRSSGRVLPCPWTCV